MWEKIKNYFKKKEVGPDYVDIELKIWAILQGPFHKYDLPHQNVPEELEFMVLCKVEKEGQVYDQELWFPDLEGVQVWKKHFETKIEPIVITLRY